MLLGALSLVVCSKIFMYKYNSSVPRRARSLFLEYGEENWGAVGGGGGGGGGVVLHHSGFLCGIFAFSVCLKCYSKCVQK